MSDFEIEYSGDLSTQITHLESGNKIITDAPKDNNGLGRTFSPTDLVASSLGSCMLTIIAISAKSNNIKIRKMSAKITKIMSDNSPRRISDILIDIFIYGSYDSKSKLIIKRSAKHCPVHKTINSNIKLNIIYK